MKAEVKSYGSSKNWRNRANWKYYWKQLFQHAFRRSTGDCKTFQEHLRPQEDLSSSSDDDRMTSSDDSDDSDTKVIKTNPIRQGEQSWSEETSGQARAKKKTVTATLDLFLQWLKTPYPKLTRNGSNS